METVYHTIEPVFNKKSKILILGTFPSVKSREGNFFYHHPQNRFWKVLSALLEEELPDSIVQKKQMLLKHRIAVWDVIHSCEIVGSSDSSIKNVIPNDLDRILRVAPIQKIYANGTKAYNLFHKYNTSEWKHDMIKLPSTSPANAGYRMEQLLCEWAQILNYIGTADGI